MKKGDLLMECNLKELFLRYKGQPIEVITESGMKYCGILVSAQDGGIDIVDGKGRTVHIENEKIEAIIEPRMRLKRLCEDNDCCCEDDDENERDYNEEDCEEEDCEEEDCDD